MFKLNEKILAQSHQEFSQPKPGEAPSTILKDLLNPIIANQCVEEFGKLSEKDFVKYSDPLFEFEKYAMNATEKMPAQLKKVFDAVHSAEFIKIIEKITGINGLLVDDGRWGGGIHLTKPGGYLAVHKDFNVLPPTYAKPKQWLRVINLIGYFNPEWKEGDGGELEIWSGDGTQSLKKIAPCFNHWAVFDTRGTYHGHPFPFKGQAPRASIAAYYYIEESVPMDQWHSTEYLKLPWLDDSPEYQKARQARADASARYAKFYPGRKIA